MVVDGLPGSRRSRPAEMGQEATVDRSVGLRGTDPTAVIQAAELVSRKRPFTAYARLVE